VIVSGLLDFIGSEPVLAAAIADCRTRRLPAFDLTLPEPVRP
jgi:hypothetical protein